MVRDAERSGGQPSDGPSDEQLVARAKAGDRSAFDALVIRYKDRIFNLCLRKLGDAEEALDASQEAFLKAYRALGAFEGKSQFYTWLFRIALNASFTRRTRRAREREVVPASLERSARGDAGADGEPAARAVDPPDPRPDPREMTLAAERAAVVEEAIASLPEDLKGIVLLRDIEGLAYEEIAEVLDIPLGSVKSRLHRARLVLRERLKAYLSS